MAKSKITAVEALALSKLVEQLMAKFKEAGETVPSGQYPYEITISAKGVVSRAASSSFTPSFPMDEYLKLACILFAAELEKAEAGDGFVWLKHITNSVLSVIPDDPVTLAAMTDKFLADELNKLTSGWKERYKATMTKNERAGNTQVTGQLEKLT
jgi:hypothetical protein